MTLLETDGLTRRFGGLTALDGVSMTLESGEILGLLGPNGAGKSVLQSCIAGAQRPDSGSITFDGKDVTGWGADQMCRIGLGRTFQIPQPFANLTVRENVLVAATFGGRSDRNESPEEIVTRCLDFVEFTGDEEGSPSALNTVMLKRLDLARALASSPRVLLLDEFAAGLMTGELDAVTDLIRRVSELEVEAVVVVEHVMRPIRAICDRAIVLERGRLIASGTVDEVMADQLVLEAYLGPKAKAGGHVA